MGEQISRVMVAIEAILLLTPLAMLSLYMLQWTVWTTMLWAEPLTAQSILFESENFDFGCALVVSIIVQVVAWAAVLIFVFGGRRGLCTIRPAILNGLTGAAIFVLYAVITSITGLDSIHRNNEFLATFVDISVWGTPALVPYFHIVLERRFLKTKFDNGQVGI